MKGKCIDKGMTCIFIVVAMRSEKPTDDCHNIAGAMVDLMKRHRGDCLKMTDLWTEILKSTIHAKV